MYDLSGGGGGGGGGGGEVSQNGGGGDTLIKLLYMACLGSLLRSGRDERWTTVIDK